MPLWPLQPICFLMLLASAIQASALRLESPCEPAFFFSSAISPVSAAHAPPVWPRFSEWWACLHLAMRRCLRSWSTFESEMSWRSDLISAPGPDARAIAPSGDQTTVPPMAAPVRMNLRRE